jgi:ABC-type transporter Mla subunit MlaD
MEYSTPGANGTSPQLPALVPSLSLPVALVRTTFGATMDVAARTVRACARVDPAAVVTALAALPAITEGIAQLVRRLALLAERVDGVLDGVEATQTRVDRVVDGIEPLSARIDAIADSAEGTVEKVDGTVESVRAQIGQVDGLLDGAGEVVAGGRRTVAQGEETIGAADPSVRQLAEITETVSRLQPLLASLSELDPAVGKDLAAMLRNLPGLVERVDDRVIPAVSALEGLMPVVQTLHENVDQLQSVVNDVGTLLSGLPGAGRLLKRGGREVRSADNKTSITPPE